MHGPPLYDPHRPSAMPPYHYGLHHAPPRFGPPAYGSVPGRPRGPLPPGYERAYPGMPYSMPLHPAEMRRDRPLEGYKPPVYGEVPGHLHATAARARGSSRRAVLTPAGEALPHHAAPSYGYQVRLSNVPPELTARDLAEAFGEVSQSRVESVDLLRNREGKATGEALVIFNAMADAHNAVRRYHGGDLNGRRLLAVYEGEAPIGGVSAHR